MQHATLVNRIARTLGQCNKINYEFIEIKNYALFLMLLNTLQMGKVLGIFAIHMYVHLPVFAAQCSYL